MARELIQDGHTRPAPEIVKEFNEELGREVVVRRTDFAPKPVHLAFDPETGIVYAGHTVEDALGTRDPETGEFEKTPKHEGE